MEILTNFSIKTQLFTVELLLKQKALL